MGLKKNNPGCGCCGATVDCGVCADSEGPRHFTITIAGVANDDCASCTDINGSYILTSFTTGSDLCKWLLDHDFDACDEYTYIRMQVWLQKIVLAYYIFVYNDLLPGQEGTPIVEAQWRDNTGTTILDCGNYLNEDIPLFQAQGTVCDYSVATCLLTSGP